MKGKIYFLGIFLITLAVAAAHQSEFPRFLLGFELLLCICLFFSVRIMSRKVTARLRLPEMFGKKNGDFRVEVELENTGVLPVPEIRVELEYTDLYDKKTGKLYGTAMLDGKGKADLCFHLTAEHCGVVAFRAEQVTVSDYLGVFCGKCKKPEEIQEISVLPQQNQQISGISGETQIFSAEGNIYDLHRPGDDPSETYDIREFRQGDALHHVHWKMTAKTDELMVRNFSQPSESTALVLFDLKKTEAAVSRDLWDHFLETAAALSGRMLQAGYVHHTAWLDKETETVVRMRVGSGEELQEMLSALLRASAYDTGDVETYYKENYADEALSEIIRVDLKGEIIRESKEEN